MAIVRAYPIRVAGPISIAQAEIALAGIPLGIGITPLHVRNIVEEFDGSSVVTYEVSLDPVTQERIDLARRLLLENTTRAVGGEAVTTTGLEASSTDEQLAQEFKRQDAATRAAGGSVGFFDWLTELGDKAKSQLGVAQLGLVAVAVIAAVLFLAGRRRGLV